MRKQAESPYVGPRLWAKIPQRRYVCFYPMSKRRGEVQNWYMLGFDARAKMMSEHGDVGRSYHGRVTQVISGSIGFDDFEWGVDLYADDPLVFKKLDLRNALRRSERALRRVRPVLGRHAVLAERTARLSRRRRNPATRYAETEDP